MIFYIIVMVYSLSAGDVDRFIANHRLLAF